MERFDREHNENEVKESISGRENDETKGYKRSRRIDYGFFKSYFIINSIPPVNHHRRCTN
jgi:hypothetical protein